MTVQPWEPRVSRREGALEQIADRLTDLHGDMTALRHEMAALRSDVDAKIDHLDTSLNPRVDRLDAKIDRSLHLMIGWMIALVTALGAFIHFVH